MEVEDRPVRRCRRVEGEVCAYGGDLRFDLRFGSGSEEDGGLHGEPLHRLAGRRRPCDQGRYRALPDPSLCGEAMAEKAVGDFACHSCHSFAHSGDIDRGRPECVRRRHEGRRHQGVAVELTFESERLPVGPAEPRCAHGQDELPHLRDGRPHGMEKRRVMCAFTCDPRPSTRRPREKRWRSCAVYATDMGEREKATAIDVPMSIRSVARPPTRAGGTGHC